MSTEVKLKQHASQGGEYGGITANIEAFAGLAQCLSKVAGKSNTQALYLKLLFFRRQS